MSPPAADARARPAADTGREPVAQPGPPFADHLPQEQIHKTSHDLGGPFRERLSTPAVTLRTSLTQVLDADHSCQIAGDRPLAFRVATGLTPCSTDTGASCKARARLPEGLPQELTRQTGRGLMGEAEQEWLWEGRRVEAVDGTGLSMPDAPGSPTTAEELPEAPGTTRRGTSASHTCTR